MYDLGHEGKHNHAGNAADAVTEVSWSFCVSVGEQATSLSTRRYTGRPTTPRRAVIIHLRKRSFGLSHHPYPCG